MPLSFLYGVEEKWGNYSHWTEIVLGSHFESRKLKKYATIDGYTNKVRANRKTSTSTCACVVIIGNSES